MLRELYPGDVHRGSDRADSLMLLVRVLLQGVIVLLFLPLIIGALAQPITAVHIGNIVGISLFFVSLLTATLFIGEPKEEQWAQIWGYRVNPKIFGVMLVILGAFILLISWRILSGQALYEPDFYVRGAGILKVVAEYPALSIPLGLATAWYGVKLFRARQPNRRKHRTRARAARAGDAER